MQTVVLFKFNHEALPIAMTGVAGEYAIYFCPLWGTFFNPVIRQGYLLWARSQTATSNTIYLSGNAIDGTVSVNLCLSEAAGALQRAGLITYQRGHITILNRAMLEKAACECYGILRDAYKQTFPEKWA